MSRSGAPPAPVGGERRDLQRLAQLTWGDGARLSVDVAAHRVEFLYWGFFEPRPWRNYLHAHSFFEVCYAYSGHGTFRTGGQDHLVEAGTLFIARPGDVHEIVSSDDDPLSIHFWSYTLVPAARGTGQGDSAGRAIRAHGRELLEAFADPAAPVCSTSAGRVPALLELLTGEAARPGPAYDDVLRGLARTLVIDTARAVVDDPALAPHPDGSPLGDEQLARTMVRYLQDNYDRPVAVRDLAAQVHLSERHANRLFRGFTGTTIHAYLVRHRLEIAAQRLLEHGPSGKQVSIAEIARSSGYPDVRHFTTAFRQHWGVTPGIFRAGDGTAHLKTAEEDMS
ncbi:helix-turn-helix domain-containing protein [Actinopolymorpha alba]|uniref:helix-turn-helix domain-containing protein n=1 Tax=Actinopolymorpha alba TaxID=533267 RepID=UPI0003728900|nr:AraC family transcriptional regulator [Actinopolymorpha alba]